MDTRYLCYLLDSERVVGVKPIDCPDDATDLTEASRILAASDNDAVELSRSYGVRSRLKG